MSCPRASELDPAAFVVERREALWAEFRSHYPTCGDCSREVAHWSKLLSVLRSHNPGASEHPAEELLLAYGSHPSELEAPQRAAIETHLAGCGACRSELAVLRGFDFSKLPAPELRQARRPSLGERLGAALAGLAQSLVALPRPALAMALLVLLLVPVAVAVWRSAGPGGEAPIARGPTDRPRLAPEAPETLPGTSESERLQIAGPSDAAPIAEDETITEPGAGSTTQERVELAATPEASPPPSAARTPAPAASPQPPMQIAALLPSELVRYRPNAALAGGSLGSIRVDTVTRSAGAELPRIQTLGPAHVGATAERTPTLYWRLSSASQVPVRVTLVDDDAIDPLLELRVEPPIAAGVHRVSLRDRAIELSPGVTYRWYVSLAPDPERPEADVTSGAAIRRAPADQALAERLEASGPGERAHVLAASGYWYDAFDTLSRWIEKEPAEPELRAQRAALLEQADLEPISD
jgi:hypothetical protein